MKQKVGATDVMWRGFFEAMDAAAMIMSGHPDIAGRVCAELEARKARAATSGDVDAVNAIGYGLAMFRTVYGHHLTSDAD